MTLHNKRLPQGPPPMDSAAPAVQPKVFTGSLCDGATGRIGALLGGGKGVGRRMDRSGLLDFIKGHRMAVQTSVSASGGPQAALVAFVMGDGFEILFDAIETSRKIRNLRRNPRVAFVIGGWMPGDKRSVQYEGIADEPSGADLDRVKRVYFGRVPGGDGPESWPDLTYVRVRPTWIRFGDFNPTPPLLVEFGAEELAGE